MVVSWNRLAEEIFGLGPSEILGRHISTIIPKDRHELLNEAIDQVVDSGQVFEFEIDQAASDGQSAPQQTLAVVIAPVTDPAGELMGLAAWVRNITNRKQLEWQLHQAEKLASLGTLASGVAHHFNNIIGGVATFVDYALETNSPQAAQRALQMTNEAAGRMSQITQSLLTFAEKDLRQFDLADLTEVVLTFSHIVEKPLHNKGITLELQLHAVPLYEVPGPRMHQVLGNLLTNAEDAMADGGNITICLKRDNNDLLLSFADTGCGIAPEDLPHIFEPFFTTYGTVSGGDQPSAGLGLSVVHGIVHELGGNLDVQSTLGSGTAMTIKFPLNKNT